MCEGHCAHCLVVLVLKAKPVFDRWRTSNSKDQILVIIIRNLNLCHARACIIFQNVLGMYYSLSPQCSKAKRNCVMGGIVKSLQPILASQVDCFQASSTYASLSCASSFEVTFQVPLLLLQSLENLAI